MRTTKGLWAAVVAGTSLAAAALLALFTLSVVLAVHGWPQVSKAGDDAPVALRAQIAAADGAGSAAAQAPAPVFLATHAAARRTAGDRRTGSHRGAVGRPGTRRPGSGAATPVTAPESRPG